MFCTKEEEEEEEENSYHIHPFLKISAGILCLKYREKFCWEKKIGIIPKGTEDLMTLMQKKIAIAWKMHSVLG